MTFKSLFFKNIKSIDHFLISRCAANDAGCDLVYRLYIVKIVVNSD